MIPNQPPPQQQQQGGQNIPLFTGNISYVDPGVIEFGGQQFKFKYTGNLTQTQIGPNPVPSKILKIDQRVGSYGPYLLIYVQVEDGYISRIQQFREGKIPKNDVGLFLQANQVMDTNSLMSLAGRNCQIIIAYQMDKQKQYKTVENAQPAGYYLTFTFMQGMPQAESQQPILQQTQQPMNPQQMTPPQQYSQLPQQQQIPQQQMQQPMQQQQMGQVNVNSPGYCKWCNLDFQTPDGIIQHLTTTKH